MENRLKILYSFLVMAMLCLSFACDSGGGGAKPDTTPPTVSDVEPNDAAIDVPLNTNILVNFNEAMDPATISDTTITVSDGTADISGTVSYSGNIATFNPTADLVELNEYTVTVAGEVADAAGNPLGADYTWSFTSGICANGTAPIPANSGTITADNVHSTGCRLNWLRAVDDVTLQSKLQYRVYRSASNNINSLTDMEDADGNVIGGITAVNSYTMDIVKLDVTGLALNTTYYFNIIVKDPSGNKAAYTPLSVTTKTAQAGVVTLVSAIADNDSITLNWTNPTSDPVAVDHVEITMGTDTWASESGLLTYTLPTAVAADTDYTLSVKAADAYGNLAPNAVTTTIRTSATSSNEEYYYLYTVSQLNAMRGGVTAGWDLSDNYIQMSNFDLTGTNWEPVGTGVFYSSSSQVVQLAPGSAPFTGTYNGNGFSINNLTINRPSTDFVGLFGAIQSAVVKDVTLTSANMIITGQKCVGGIAGMSDNSTITDCTVGGKVTGTSYAGGIVGYAAGPSTNGTSGTSGTIANCTAAVTINEGAAGHFAGGIAGCVYYLLSFTDNSVTAGSVEGLTYTGGGVGSASFLATFANCSSAATVTASDMYTGGLVGFLSYSGLSASSATGAVSNSGNMTDGVEGIGGLIGFASFGNTESIVNCSATGQVTANNAQYVGGFAGELSNGANTDGCNASGTVSAGRFGGGFVGMTSLTTVKNCLATNLTVSSAISGGGFAGRNDGTMENCSATASVTSTGNDTSGWFGSGGFAGENYGTLTLCHATGAVSNAGPNTGGLVGRNDGSISKCYCTGNVTGTVDNTGGLVGLNKLNNWASVDTQPTTMSLTVANCYAAGNVVGGNNVGALIGKNLVHNQSNFGGTFTFTITNCYASGDVDGTTNVDGILGALEFINTPANGTLTNSFTGCYYDTTVTGLTGNTYGTPKTTAELKTQTTYSGWNFTTVWNIGTGYPYLR